MIDWIHAHPALVWSLAIGVVMFAGTLIIVPVLVARVPADYFMTGHRGHVDTRHPVVRLTVRVIKNLAGWTLFVAGIVMCFVPGQGLLSMLAGLMLMEFPGKFRVERWLVSRPRVLRTVNWLRRRQGRPPLRLEEPDAPPAGVDDR